MTLNPGECRMISANPKATFPHVLACDRQEPRSRQARWFLKNLSQAEWEEYRRLGTRDQPSALRLRPEGGPETGEEKTKPEEERPPEEIAAELWAALRIIVAGWTGVRDAAGEAIPFDPERLEEALTMAEAWELYYAGLQRLELTGDDRKNSESRRPSASAASAGPAAA
jgi:hypothetical protein